MKKRQPLTIRFIALLNLPVIPTIITAVIIIFLLSVSLIIGIITHNSRIQEERLAALSSLGIIRSDIEGALNSRLLLGQGLVSYISVKPGLTSGDFNNYAEKLVASDPMIRNISVLKGTTISFAYPAESNKKAIGVDLSKIPSQKDSVLKVIKTRRAAVIVNVNLVQGGIGTVSRIPIFTGSGSGEYWGQVSIVLMQDILFKKSGLTNGSHGLKLSLRTINDDGTFGDSMYGDKEILKKNPIELDVKFPNGSWRLSAIPEQGWGYSDHSSLWYFTGGSIISVMLGLLLFLVMKLGRRLHELESILPICSDCKKIRNDRGYWDSVDSFLSEHSTIQFSHSLCPDCADKLYGGQGWYKKKKSDA